MSFKYGVEYYENLLEMYAGSMEKISMIRWGVIAQLEAQTILDYGSGNNAFSLFRPDGVIIDSYDIGTIGKNVSYPQTGIRHQEYDLICLWDVIEHVNWKSEPDNDMLDAIGRSQALAATIPILPEGQELETWKHYKPGEHLTYFTVGEFLIFMSKLGFELLYHEQPECPPRQDIHTFMFRRR